MNNRNPEVDFFFEKPGQWQPEFLKLREICLDTGLDEELKWGHPCYVFKGSNIVLIHGFKEYCALLLFKGVLLQDPEGILVQQTENVQAARQIRFTDVAEISELADILKAYIHQAIEVEKAGLKVKKKQTKDYPVAAEFQSILDANPNVKAAFRALTPGRQRAYLFYFSQPKTSKTRETRVEKSLPRILEGKGLSD